MSWWTEREDEIDSHKHTGFEWHGVRCMYGVVRGDG